MEVNTETDKTYLFPMDWRGAQAVCFRRGQFIAPILKQTEPPESQVPFVETRLIASLQKGNALNLYKYPIDLSHINIRYTAINSRPAPATAINVPHTAFTGMGFFK